MSERFPINDNVFADDYPFFRGGHFFEDIVEEFYYSWIVKQF